MCMYATIMYMKETQEKNNITISKLRSSVVAVDVVIFSIIDEILSVLIVPIDRPPFYVNTHGLPGGVILGDENADQSASRHLKEKANITNIHIEQLYTFSDVNRDKRSRSISIAYMALVGPDKFPSKMKDKEQWVPVSKLPKLAFDHKEIIKVALDRLKGKLAYTNIVANLLPKHFTLSELQHINEIILGYDIDKRNFRKKVIASGVVKATGTYKKASKRPAELYTF